MAIFPVRDLGKGGIITDRNRFDVDLNAWTDGCNVRFWRGKALRSPLLKTMTAYTGPAIVAMASFRQSTGDVDTLFGFGSDGQCYTVEPSVQPVLFDTSGIKGTSEDDVWSVVVLADVLYANRPDIGIKCLTPGAASFVALKNTGDTPWSCKLLRGYEDFLVAFGITRNGFYYSNMVKWSDAALAGEIPGNWDATQSTANATTLSGENVLSEMDGPIVDAAVLKDAMIIYGRNEVWMMSYTGEGTYVFNFSRLFGSGGALGPNCAVEANGYHYVFGTTQIYRHNGVSIEPLIGVSDRVYSERTRNDFVVHDKQNCSILFCYRTSDAQGSFCNKAAVFNYQEETWSFVDLPNISGFTLGMSMNALDWDSPGLTSWDANTLGSETWGAFEGSYASTLLLAATNPGSDGKHAIFQYDAATDGTANYTAEDRFNPDPWLERTGLLFDISEEPAMLLLSPNVLKQLRSIMPLSDGEPATPMWVQLGGQYSLMAPLSWTDRMQFDPATQYQLNTRMNGRAIGVRFGSTTVNDFNLSGFDLDVIPAGKR